ncbi:MAG: hypothetical protein GF400_02650 [Candidatus Eisenbacteria bacterium]|nr:hypothetical protein [Candidatus Eisenbacteria bacterium]
MKKLVIAAATLACVLFVAQAAFATSYSIGLTGSGSLMKNGATYSGTFMFGMSGTWTIDIDDSLWPDESDSNARWDYIWSVFEYDDTVGAKAWYGTFSQATIGATPTFEFVTTSPGGTVAGDCTFRIMIRDWSGDGVLQQREKHDDSQIVYTLSIDPTRGTGIFENWCGYGSISSGNFRFVNPPQDNMLEIAGQLITEECPSPVEESSWSTIKALYN